MSQLASLDKTVKDWLEESHDNSEYINGVIATFGDRPGAFLVLDEYPADLLLDKKELRRLGQGPDRVLIRHVQKIVSHLRVVDNDSMLPPINGSYRRYLPLAMPDLDLFGAISHLIHEGMQFSLFPTVIMAFLVYMSDYDALKPRAEAFLNSVKGKWSRLENLVTFPEFACPPILSLVMRAPQWLSEGERDVASRLNTISRIRYVQKASLEFNIPFVPNVKSFYGDYKVRCSRCNSFRSFTLITKNGYCGLCSVDLRETKGVGKIIEELGYPDNLAGLNMEVENSKRSRLTECESCHAIYSVIRVDAMHVRPKCHFCRFLREPAPFVTCGNCRNKYVCDYMQCLPLDLQQNFLCSLCNEEPRRSMQSVATQYSKLFDANPQLTQLFGSLSSSDKAWKLIKSSATLFSIYVNSWDVIVPTNGENLDAAASVSQLQWFGKPILMTVDELNELKSRLMKGFILETCDLCFSDFAPGKLNPVCGRCQHRVCVPCGQEWYGALKPGRLFLSTNYQCPFCKKEVTRKALKQYNWQLSFILQRHRLRLDTSWYYAWCIGCDRVKQYIERQCGGGELPQLVNHRCDDCIQLRNDGRKEKQFEMKTCPACTVMVMKTGGCNHITCTCGAHWCWECCEAFPTGQETYEHLDKVHSAIWDLADLYEEEYWRDDEEYLDDDF
jgi:hypothetical protein